MQRGKAQEAKGKWEESNSYTEQSSDFYTGIQRGTRRTTDESNWISRVSQTVICKQAQSCGSRLMQSGVTLIREERKGGERTAAKEMTRAKESVR